MKAGIHVKVGRAVREAVVAEAKGDQRTLSGMVNVLLGEVRASDLLKTQAPFRERVSLSVSVDPDIRTRYDGIYNAESGAVFMSFSDMMNRALWAALTKRAILRKAAGESK